MLRIAGQQCCRARVVSRFHIDTINGFYSMDSYSDECSQASTRICIPPARFFSHAPPQSKSGRTSDDGPLLNKELINFLVRKSASDARDISVRLVVQKGKDQPSKSEVVSLMEAVQISANLDLDLVGINVEQSPPILKVLDHEKASYQSEKKASGGGGKTKPTKEFKFKAGIAHNDFSRKASDVLKYLKKGHSCLLTITANAASRRQDPDGLDKLVQRLKDEIADAAIQGKFTTNPEMSHATLMLQPNNK